MIEGKIERAGICFKEFLWAYSEAQAKKLTWLRQKEKHPNIKVFLKDVTISAL